MLKKFNLYLLTAEDALLASASCATKEQKLIAREVMLL